MDNQLQSLLHSFGSPEEALKKVVFITVGDSGMTQILPEQDHPTIDLASMFKDYKVFRQGEKVTDETEIVFAVNETMAYVYTLKEKIPLKSIANVIKADPRIDFISWKEKGWNYVLQGETGKQLRFKTKGKLIDPYQQKWTVEQDAGVLDLKINALHHDLKYGKYPDAL